MKQFIEQATAWYRDNYGLDPHKDTRHGGDQIVQAYALGMQASLAAASTSDAEPVKWPNKCDESVPAALRYLAENSRPTGGEEPYNSAHLYQLAAEIEMMVDRVASLTNDT